MRQLYINVDDYQNSDFAIGRTLTAKGWQEQALDWLDSDDNPEAYDYFENFNIENEKALIDTISDWWEIKIVPYNPFDDEHYRLRKEDEHCD